MIRWKRRQSRLSQTDAAVIRWNRSVRPDFQPLAVQQLSHVGKQQVVLENSSREHNRIHLTVAAQLADRVCQSPSHSALKGSCYVVRIEAALTVLSHCQQQRTKI
jgi:hypothetical protein